MIAKLVKGKGFRGALEYDLREQKGHILDTNMGGDNPRELAREFGTVRALRPNLTKAVCHVSISLPPDEKLTDDQWKDVAGKYLEGMGFTVVPFGQGFKDMSPPTKELMKLVLEVLERMVTRLEKKQEKPERVAFNQIVEYISVNLRLEQLTPASLCLSFYISERTLSRMFAKNIGISPAKYIMLKRVEFSKQLLSTTKYTVEEISEMLHFPAPGIFAMCLPNATACRQPNGDGRTAPRKGPLRRTYLTKTRFLIWRLSTKINGRCPRSV